MTEYSDSSNERLEVISTVVITSLLPLPGVLGLLENGKSINLIM